MISIPRELDSKRRELQELISQHEKIIELRPKNVEFSNLREVDIPKLEEGIKSIQSNLDELQSQIEKVSFSALWIVLDTYSLPSELILRLSAFL